MRTGPLAPIGGPGESGRVSIRAAHPVPDAGGGVAPLVVQTGAVVAGTSLQPDDLASVVTRATLIAGALDWHSSASAAFEARLGVVVAALRAASDELDQARDLLRRYAAAHLDGAR